MGIPVALALTILLVLTLGTTAALSAFMFQQQQGATVTIKGSGAALFKDQACTQPLLVSDVLAFGEVRATANSTTVTVWLKNTGTDTLKPTLSVTNLDSALALTESTYGAINSTPKPLYIPDSATWAPDATSGIHLAAAITATQVAGITFADVDKFATYQVVKLENEYIHYTSVVGGGKELAGVTRGYGFSTPAAHDTTPVGVCGTLTINAGTPMAVGAVLPIALTLSAPGDVTGKLGNLVNFQITVTVTSNY